MITAKDLRNVAKELNVLYAEDEAILRESMQSTLSKLFKNIFVANNGQEAFEILKKENIDILITDLNMPIMDGFELINSIQRYTDKEPLIVVLSAHNESKVLTSLINLGIHYFINKPLNKDVMTNILYRACSNLHDRQLVLAYEKQLQDELAIMQRKNMILEQKINQLASQTNKSNRNKTSGSKTLQKTDSIENYYSTLLLEDKDELSDLSSEIENYLAMLFQGERLNEDYIYKVSSVYQKYASTLNSYPEFFDIGAFLYEFSQKILSLEEKFMQDLNQTGIYFESMQLSLDNFRKNVIAKEAKDPKFYNASLKNDIQLVLDYLEDKEAKDNEIEFF